MVGKSPFGRQEFDALTYFSRGINDDWQWIGLQSSNGYGVFRIGQRFREYSHRVVWTLTHGKIPHKLEVCHSCDIPLCVNPQHLFLDTQAGNTADAAQKGRFPRGIKHHNAKLSNDDILNIRRSSKPDSELSKLYKVSPSHISSIKRGRYWRHI